MARNPSSDGMAPSVTVAFDLLDAVVAIVLLGLSDVEGFCMDRITRRLERGDEGAANVFDVNDRPLGRTVDQNHTRHRTR